MRIIFASLIFCLTFLLISSLTFSSKEKTMLQRSKENLPDWLRCPRFFTKDSGRGELSNRKPGDIAEMVQKIAENGGNAFRLSVFWGGEAYFQSEVAPHAPGLGDIDYLKEAIEAGDKYNVRIIAYMNPNAIYKEHPLYPECVIKNTDGKIWNVEAYGKTGAYYACINNPKYRKFLLDLIKEIFTDYRPDGLYVDGLTPHICYCKYCKEMYRRMFDQKMKEKFSRHGPFCVLWEMTSVPELIGDPADADSKKITEFLYTSLSEITKEFTSTVKRLKPDAVTIYHSWPKPRTIEQYDATLNEIYIKEPWRYTLWKDGEFASYGSVFPIPVLVNIYLEHHTAIEARHKMFQVLANGSYPNAWNFLGMKPIFNFMKENAEYLDFSKTEPVKFLAFPRAIRLDSRHRKIANEASFDLVSGEGNLLEISEREPNGKIDLLCLRKDGKIPSSEEYIQAKTKVSEDSIYLPAASFKQEKSVKRGGEAEWKIESDEEALSGRYIFSRGHGKSEPPAMETKLIYELPAQKKDSTGWTLWARVKFPNSGSDSFYFRVSNDNGKSWSELFAVGWEVSEDWIWVKARTYQPSATKRFLSPYVGLYSALLHARVPITTFHRNMISDVAKSDYKVLALANEACLNREQIEAITDFVQEGGGLIATGSTSLFDGKGIRRKDFGLAKLFGAHFSAIVSQKESQKVVFHGEHSITKNLSGSIPYLQSYVRVKPEKATVVARLRKEDSPEGDAAVLANEYGRGRVVYIPIKLDSLYSRRLDYKIPKLFYNAVLWSSSGNIPIKVKTETHSVIGVTLFEQREKGRWLIHLVNHSAPASGSFDKFQPAFGVKILLKIPSEQKIAKIHSLWKKRILSYEKNNEKVLLILPKLEEYELICVEFKNN